ncbi:MULTISPECIES: CmcJ/NvfI family oxidoreductase [unclassified Roseateles]|uniref:CmcJ/NvfI family oxidoreductase n=1 Tax=unclassified Roseateles TaxID=2626991 RepID=UPI0006F4CDE3|nr:MULTISPECIES: CmcJ/NvfI family oxidoreductase [unclassified Roseateles]KQW49529.1 methyltransferase [Pelomonas sp. Root405]KRA75587.1 methyltransferase [Pelomonas sp. Root662]
MTSQLAKPGIRAGLNYLKPTAERPYSYVCEPPPGMPWENCGYALHHTLIADARQASERPCLEREGFALWDAPTTVIDFLNEAAVKAIYYQEAAELALAATGARQAYVFDHLVRQREAGRSPLSFGRSARAAMAAANGRIHNDYTEASGRRRLTLVIDDVQAAARVRRYGIVNIWRSIKGPVLDTPLAVCDARTVRAADLVESEVRYPRRTGEIYVAKHSQRHRWSYFPEMDRHEALVFKQYDSRLSGVARFTLHSAFDLPEIPPDAPLRESIELRCLVVYESEEP